MAALVEQKPVFFAKVGGMPGAQVVRFNGYEAVSSLYEFRVEVAADEVDLAAVVGQAASLTFEGAGPARHVHGEIACVEYVGETRRYHLYELTIVPRLWRLLQRQDCRIFQHKTTIEVVQDVLKRAGLSAEEFRFEIASTYSPRNYCVQYRETDLVFLSRLLEEDGLCYFFEHKEPRAVLVIADHPRAHPPIAGEPVVWFNAGGELATREHVSEFRSAESVRPGRVSLRDFNFHKPEEALDADASAPRDADLEVYDYPGEYKEASLGGPHLGRSMAKIRLEALQVTRRQGAGASDCMRLSAGRTFALFGHGRADFNREFMLTRVVHQGAQPQVLGEDAQGSFHYTNQFSCIEKAVPFRPPRTTPRPVMRGVQSATVVGAGTEEVHVDEQGRVLVQFHWDREGKRDENSSCWVRVSQLWAGVGWGAMFIPRVGHEVLVDFIEGDPDRPIITGRVYHASNQVPYPLPDEKTKSTIKTESSPGGGGFNELRFEDRKGAEEVFLHAQRDLNEVVLNDNSRTVTANQMFSVGGNQSFTITKNRSVTVTEGDESLTVTKGKSTTTVKMDRAVTVQTGSSSLTVETGSRTVTVKQGISETSQSASIDLTAQKAMTLKAVEETFSATAKTDVSLTSETATLSATAKTDVSLTSETATLSAIANKDVTLMSQTATLTATAMQAVSVASLTSTLSLSSLQPASLTSLTNVAISAPLGVSVAGGLEVGVRANKVLITGEQEITLQVGSSAITIKPDGITVSGPKITSTAVGLHEISGALIKIN